LRPFTCAIAATVLPKRCAIWLTVSPACTVYSTELSKSPGKTGVAVAGRGVVGMGVAGRTGVDVGGSVMAGVKVGGGANVATGLGVGVCVPSCVGSMTTGVGDGITAVG